MATIKSEELKDQNVIAKLNTEIAKKEIVYLRIYNQDSLMFAIITSDFDKMWVKSNGFFFSVTNLHPYFNLMLFYEEFTHIEVNDKVILSAPKKVD